MVLSMTTPWSSNSKSIDAKDKGKSLPCRREPLFQHFFSRYIGPLAFYTFVGLFWGFFVVLFSASLSARVAKGLLRRCGWTSYQMDDSLEDMVPEDEVALLISDDKFLELDDLEELCTQLSVSDDSGSETLLGWDECDDPFADPQETPIFSVPLVYFLHRKLEGLPMRPDTPLHPTIRLPRSENYWKPLPYGQTRFIHGPSPLYSRHSAIEAEDDNDDYEDDYNDKEDDASSIDIEELPELDWANQDELFVARGDDCLPRVRKFASLPCILALENTAYDMDVFECRKQHLSRKERDTMLTFLSE